MAKRLLSADGKPIRMSEKTHCKLKMVERLRDTKTHFRYHCLVCDHRWEQEIPRPLAKGEKVFNETVDLIVKKALKKNPHILDD